MYSIALFGGAFDPIHKGHIKVIRAIAKHLPFNEFRLIPAKESLLKPPMQASTEQRLAMLRLALQKYPNLNLDLQEIKRPGPSYTVDTLTQLRKEYPKAAISLIIGFDALLSLPRWHQWSKIIELANVLVLDRVGYRAQKLPSVLSALVKNHQALEYTALLQQKSGVLCFYNAGHFDISSSMIREKLSMGRSVRFLLEPDVYEYIITQQLYK